MSRKYFFENQSSLQRKFIAGGLAATFAFGTVGSSFAGAAQVLIQMDNTEKYEPKNITKKELTDMGINVEANLDFIKKIDSEYEHWEKEIFGDESREKIRMFLGADDVENFNKEWGNFPNKSAFIFSLLIKRRKDGIAFYYTWNDIKTNFCNFFCATLFSEYKAFHDVLRACNKAQIQNSKPIVMEEDVINSAQKVNNNNNNNNNNVEYVNISLENTEDDNKKIINSELFEKKNIPTKNFNQVKVVNISLENTENYNKKIINSKLFVKKNISTNNSVKENVEDVIRKKSLVHNKIIWGIGVGVVVVLAVFLIVYFAIHGGNKQEINETVDPRNGQVGGNQAGNNEIDQTKQKQPEENSEIKRSFGVDAKILKRTAVTLIGGTGGPFLYNEISSKHKNAVKQKHNMITKRRINNRPYNNYIDSAGKVVTKN